MWAWARVLPTPAARISGVQVTTRGAMAAVSTLPADGRPNWDWNSCHSYHYVNYGQGNVSPTIWEGANPPPPAPWQAPNMCWSLFIPRPC